ncbi:tryptophan halogenase family protein [Thalassotalea agarivorans]|uniref:Tryptophan halogenase n=1 Tax=Thalassotalea agarivorans TaxID=349064 RepID=A0A1I0E195_THASX|nr:tryptophan halogenase family protein [Thalassotalea agarivorans]SET38832.1 tryptophan halogenase [Thalassotalea agarivorans]
MSNKPVKKVVIAGGGTAGWMAAAAFGKLMGKQLDITLVESDEISTVGVGEATIPTMVFFHRLLNVSEKEFMQATNGTFKLGINFENWRDVNEDYLHAFGVTGKASWAAGFQHFWRKGKDKGFSGDFGDYCLERVAAEAGKFQHLPNNGLSYAYHIDAGLYAKFLRQLSEACGVKRVEGKIEQVNTDADTGFITSLTLAKGDVIDGDFFIDCTGFRGLLIEQALHTGYEDWSHWLPCDSAIAVQTQATQAPIPYTRSIAHQAGWQWRIPLQNRVGNGLVFCSKYLSDENAKQLLLENIEGDTLNQPRVIKFRTGRRLKTWNKNCLAVGLSSGFLEPLESTSIHLIQQSIVRFIKLFPAAGVQQCDIDEFNYQTNFDVEKIRDFIILHYKVTHRNDSEFWRYCRNMEVPASLAHRIALFKETGRMFREGDELFDDSWQQVMIGQGLIPEAYHPIVDSLSDEELKRMLLQLKNNIARTVDNMPSHEQYLAQFCPAH